jgi:hypothetical protein
MVKWKRRSIFAIRDFPPILGKFNPYLSEERRRVLHTHLTQFLTNTLDGARGDLIAEGWSLTKRIRPPKNYLPLYHQQGLLMYKLNVLAGARVVHNMVVCKYEVKHTRNCILESKFKSKLIKS